MMRRTHKYFPSLAVALLLHLISVFPADGNNDGGGGGGAFARPAFRPLRPRRAAAFVATSTRQSLPSSSSSSSSLPPCFGFPGTSSSSQLSTAAPHCRRRRHRHGSASVSPTVPPLRMTSSSSSSSEGEGPSSSTSDERTLRDEIAQKASIVEDEGRFGVSDDVAALEPDAESEAGFDEAAASGVAAVEASAAASAAADDAKEKDRASTTTAASKGTADAASPTTETTAATTTTKEKSPLRAKIERATRPRAYPLFLAEKAAIALDDTLRSVGLGGGSSSASYSSIDVIDGKVQTKKREKIVVLGTGWGSAAFLKDMYCDEDSKYDVTVISPRNFFLFTPMLAGASVGTVEYRSITEPVREINSKVNYLEATATDIDIETNTVSCESITCEGNSCKIEDFDVEYDRLVLAVGAQTNTFGIPGVREHCCFLKQVEDAQRIRTAIVNCFERANLPILTDEERENALTFAVIGAGPTGVEFASELRDFVESDGPKYYPKLLRHVRIKVIEASSTVLVPFDKSLQEEAIRQLTRRPSFKDPAVAGLLPDSFQLTQLLLDSGVAEVKEDAVLLNDGTEIPYGLAVWAAGNGPLPITLRLIDALGPNGGQDAAQAVARGRIAVDPWLRVLGGSGRILALGDCSCVAGSPGVGAAGGGVGGGGGQQLPATAQVAGQQGEYLARLLSQNYDLSPAGADADDDKSAVILPPMADPSREKTLAEKIAAFAIQSDDFAAPFQFLNLGILAYTGGGSALAQLQVAPGESARVKGRGKIGFALWRSVYLSKQVSWRNRFLVFVDWAKAQIFGRDITRL